MAEPRLAIWLSTGQRFVVWGWGKKGGRGERKLWCCRRVPVTLDMICERRPSAGENER
jgi:hypothetical protein